MHLNLNPDFEHFVNEKINSGSYDSASDVIHAALELLQRQDRSREEMLAELRQEIVIGLEQADKGELAPLDAESIKAKGRELLA